METQKDQTDSRRHGEKSYPRLRIFCSTALLTLCIVLLGIGFIVVDYNTRRVGFGESSLRIDVSTQDGRIMMDLLGREKSVQISENVQKWAGRIWNLVPPNIRATSWIFETEREASPYVLEWIETGTNK